MRPTKVNISKCLTLFFGGIFSHAVLKIPRAGDFRVQVQFGGQYSNFAPRLSTKKIAQDIVDSYENIPVYARIDGIETSDNFYLMEVELYGFKIATQKLEIKDKISYQSEMDLDIKLQVQK